MHNIVGSVQTLDFMIIRHEVHRIASAQKTVQAKQEEFNNGDKVNGKTSDRESRSIACYATNSLLWEGITVLG
jgi:hypothetical protein